ncbi:ATP-binding protein [Saccharicrinis sp. FJH54]|uniref:HAMP domain-containing sensor histidine kinase n=1 Tax=Saccharicrinis sp. FJH54 TaxID=3344665 RepID=UPI0035D49747
MKLKYKLILMLVPVIILVTVLTLVVLKGSRDVKKELNILMERDVSIVKMTSVLLSDVNDIVPLVDKLTQSISYHNDWERDLINLRTKKDTILSALDNLSNKFSNYMPGYEFDYTDQVFYDKLALEIEMRKSSFITEYEDFRDRLNDPESSPEKLIKSGVDFRAKAIDFSEFLRHINSRYHRQFDDFVRHVIAHTNRNFALWLGLMFVIFAVGIFLAVHTFRTISNPLEKLKEGVVEIKKGNLWYRINENPNSEFSKIFEEFNNMASRLSLARAEVNDKNEELIRANRKLNEEKHNAESADRLKSAFLANMSHEIRTPMNGIVGFTELLNEEGLTEEERREYRSVIKVCSNQLLRIIDDILDISKLEAGQLKLIPEHVDLCRLFRQVQTIYNGTDKIPDDVDLLFEIKWECKEDIWLDAKRLSQIIINLVDNALKFTEKGFVKVTADKIKDKLSIKVTDTGIGIPPEKQKDIFERFTQAHTDSFFSGKHSGTGLGLSIVKALVNLMDGEVGLTSGEGEGTEFSILLPLNTTGNASSYSDTSR